MILKFPDFPTLRLALTTGAVPPAVGAAAASAGVEDSGAVWVETAEAVPRAAQNDLRRLGVTVARAAGVALDTPVGNWAELLPLQPDPASPAADAQTPVLFELTTGAGLARLVAEILRQGNDRQGFRWLEDAAAKNGDGRALLRVVGPPYYSLLRALDGNGKGDAPAAFAERSPGVWVELGYTHPLAGQLKPPAGKLLLLRPPRRWTLLDDAPFRDVYEIAEFALPDSPVRWRDGEPAARVRVAPTLNPSGPPEGAELWLLRDDPVEELNRFVQNADDQLVRRLAFAAGEHGGRQVIALRVRPSKLPPPVLVLKAEGYRPYLKLPNLFLPAGTRLHPPLRRDVVRKLLADDPAQVTWLAPGPGGSFTPEGLPEEAFRPLADWVDYVLDRDRVALAAWVQATRFDFEPFVCADDLAAKPKKPPTEKTRSPKGPRGDSAAGAADAATFARPERAPKKSPAADDDALAVAVPAEPSEAQKRLKELEEQFLATQGGLDAPARQALWPELAALNAATGGVDDAGVCWANALWSADGPTAAYARRWFLSEASAVPVRPGKVQPKARAWTASAATGDGREVSGDDLDRLLALGEPVTADARALAAYVTRAASRTPPPAALAERLPAVQAFLEEHEKLLPVRAAWLAWTGLTRLSGGDVLALARARDRLLERLFQNGLRPEQDLPGFLRFAGQPAGQRFRNLKAWMLRLCESARAWSARQGRHYLDQNKSPETQSYIDLLFAFGLARLGEVEASRELMRRAESRLGEGDDAHLLLLDGFRYRVQQVLDSRTPGGPLPASQLEYLEILAKNRRPNETDQRYVVERMRALSRVLEPEQRLNAYRHHLGRDETDQARELAALPDVHDRAAAAALVRRVLGTVAKGPRGTEIRANVLRAGLDQAPRIGEALATELLDLVGPTFDALPDAAQLGRVELAAQLLEKALFVAAHFDRHDHVTALVGRFERLLDGQRDAPTVEGVDSVAGQCFRGLRKLGMREETDRLLRRMAAVVLKGGSIGDLEGRTDKAAALRALLHVAGGWYYFGRDAEAEPVVRAARSALYNGEFADKPLEHTSLACVYAATVGQAQAEAAQKRLEELFEKLTGVRDTFTTGSHYSQTQLRVVESVVLAVVSDDFTLGTQARRWLDDDEFLVRRRIHRDLRAAMG